MSATCVKCNQSIKPATLAITLADKKYHPTCVSCSICHKPLWGKPFRREKIELSANNRA